MNKKVLILLGSPRKNGNTERLANEFAKGAADAGNEVSTIALQELKINHCIGCRACRKNGGKCFQKDDMQTVYDAMLAADCIVFASPVYFYSWTSMMKTVLDRSFAVEEILMNKKFFFITTGAAPDESYMQIPVQSYQKYIGCFRGEGNTDGGYVIGCGNALQGDFDENPTLQAAYRLGTTC